MSVLKKKAQVILLPKQEKAIKRDIILNTPNNKLMIMDSRKSWSNFDTIHVKDSSFYEWDKAMLPQHLYIVFSDEEINKDCYYIDELNQISTAFKNNAGFYKDCKKVISSTDKSLNLPEPSPEFISKFITEFNKGNIIEDVLIEYQKYFYHPDNNEIGDYQIKVDKNNQITISKAKNTYTKEETVILCLKMQHDYTKYKKSCHYGPDMREIANWTDNWIEQNL